MAAEDSLCGKGYELTLFVFTDIIVVAKVSFFRRKILLLSVRSFFRERQPRVWG